MSIPRKGGGSEADRERERDPVFVAPIGQVVGIGRGADNRSAVSIWQSIPSTRADHAPDQGHLGEQRQQAAHQAAEQPEQLQCPVQRQ